MSSLYVWQAELVATVALLLLIFILRGAAARAVRSSRLSNKQRRRWLVQIRTVAVLTLVFGITVIWAEELRTVAISLMAIAVAFTIATKIKLVLRFPTPVRQSSRMGQAILRRFLEKSTWASDGFRASVEQSLEQ